LVRLLIAVHFLGTFEIATHFPANLDLGFLHGPFTAAHWQCHCLER
jgi:hypothetical protein